MSTHLERGRLLFEQDRYEDAAREFAEAMSELPEDSRPRAWLSLSLSYNNKAKEGQKLAQEAIALDPQDDFAFYALAVAERELNRPFKAEEAIRNAIEIDPYDAAYFGFLSFILMWRSRYREALEAAEHGLSLDPDDAGCRHARAQALTVIGDKASAKQSAQETVSDNPDSSSAHASLGWVSLRRGDHREAEEHFRTAIQLDPNNDWAREGLLDSLRARFPLYRLLIRFGTFMEGAAKPIQYLVLAAIFIGHRLIRVTATASPALRPILIPLFILVSLFIWMTWFGEAIANIALLFHPLGRLALPRSVRYETYALGSILFAGVILALAGSVVYPNLLGPAVIAGLGVIFMGFTTRMKEGTTRSVLFWGLFGLFGAGTAAATLITLMAEFAK